MKREIFPTLLVSVLCLLAACTGTGDGQEPVRNIIFMIGDGMGLPQVTALSLEQGYAPTRMERATYTGIQKTYSAGGRITDSAAAGTALACGEKTTNGTIGMTPDGRPLESVLRRAQRAGKATGIVVTCAVTDATPAAFVAHNPDRYAQEYTALQYAGSGIDLLVGAGREYFDRRSDGRDLTDEMCSRGYAFAPDREALLAARTTPLAALFPGDALPLAARDTAGIRGDYLVRATQKAIELLSGAGHDGFFLMVEGSLIDRAAHENDTEGMEESLSEETRELFERSEEVMEQMERNGAEYEQMLGMLGEERRPEERSAERRDARIAGGVTVSFSLARPVRHAVNLPVPSYKCSGGGTVVVDIVVSRNGDVLSASVDKSRSASDNCMTEAALEVAMRSRFNVDPSAPGRHSGTVTYVFVPQ